MLEDPQSGERTRGRRNIENQRASQPSKKRFAVRRILGSGDLWVTEFILTYDGKPSYPVSIMEFTGDKAAGKHSTLRIHSRLSHGALNGSDGWTHNLKAREFANDAAICGFEHNCREQRVAPKTRKVLTNAVTGKVELTG